jgi:hypothetical protein
MMVVCLELLLQEGYLGVRDITNACANAKTGYYWLTFTHSLGQTPELLHFKYISQFVYSVF